MKMEPDEKESIERGEKEIQDLHQIFSCKMDPLNCNSGKVKRNLAQSNIIARLERECV